ncbi:MAG: HAD family phosphatase [Armatimonadetes bacterium]|nr:HAD family phosphatase [Armatimonadota bacterium]
MIEIIVSDLGKVLLPFDTEPVWEQILAACPECADTRGVFQQVFAEADFGRGVTDPEEFYRRLVHATGMSLSFDDFCRIWSDMFWEDEATISLILSAPVRERHILSNTNAIHWDWILARHGEMIRRFDRAWTSHEMGLEKPDPAIYEQVIRATGLPPEAHVFIDDIEENVEGARSVGMAAIHHTDADSLAREFERLGLLNR